MVTSVNNSTSSIGSSTSSSSANNSSTTSSTISSDTPNNGSAILSALGGSQIDIQALATNLVNAERAPLQKMLDDQKTVLDNRISSIGRIYSTANDMKTQLATFGKDPRLFAYTPQSTDTSKATFAFTANPTNFNLSFEVKQLATENSITLEGMDSAGSWPTAGQLVITQGRRGAATGSALTFNYADYASIDALKDAINTAGPYKAQVLTSVSPTGTTRYLSISRGTGAERNFFVSTTDGNTDLTTGLYVKPPTYTGGVITTDPGQANGVDATIVSGGHEYKNFKNSFTDLMPGVVITVNALTDLNKPVSLSTSVDTSKFASIVRKIVSSYNDLQGTISDEIKYDLDVKKRGGLANDYVARSFLQQMRRMTTDSITTVNGNSVSLASLGVRTNIDGSLTIDETKLSAAMQNPELMEAVLASTTNSTGTIKGAFEKMNDFADIIMGKKGALVTLYDKTEKTDMKKYEDKLAKLNSDMDALKQRYMKQFIAMQEYLNTTKSAQNSLTQSMTAWTASMKG